MVNEAAKATPRIWSWLLVELGIGVAALIVTGFLSPALQPTTRIACAFSLLASLGSLAAVHKGYAHGTNGLLAAIVAGFFARMILLGVGLVGNGARGDKALAFTFAFFALFVLTQGTEIAYCISRSRSRAADAA